MLHACPALARLLSVRKTGYLEIETVFDTFTLRTILSVEELLGEHFYFAWSASQSQSPHDPQN